MNREWTAWSWAGSFAEKAAGGWEINLILIAAAASLAVAGAGRFSADHYLTAWFRPRR